MRDPGVGGALAPPVPELLHPGTGVSVVAFVVVVVLFTGALTGMWSRPRTTIKR